VDTPSIRGTESLKLFAHSGKYSICSLYRKLKLKHFVFQILEAPATCNLEAPAATLLFFFWKKI
jgi:hypothetical protein